MNKPDPGVKTLSYSRRTARWWWRGALALGLLLVIFGGVQAANAGSTAPGSENDPLITESWAKAYIAQTLQEEKNTLQQLEARLQKLETGAAGRPVPAEPGSSAAFAIVTVAAGEKLLAGSGTEIILRSGRAKVLAGPGGGLSDLTAGCNLATGAPVKADHLLLSSRDDGRGLIPESPVILLIRGDYRVE
ncbi:MAG: hypothetical protein GX334_06640 [Firmicutes bacterium]|nr:hypothetical protein [Bacillota bacterium]